MSLKFTGMKQLFKKNGEKNWDNNKPIPQIPYPNLTYYKDWGGSFHNQTHANSWFWQLKNSQFFVKFEFLIKNSTFNPLKH